MESPQRTTSVAYERPFRPRLIRWANTAGRALARVGWRGAELGEESLVAAARRRTGLHDLGDDTLRARLRILLGCLETEARLHPVGRFMVRENLIRILANRLRIQALFEKHPEILTQRIAPPIFIVGLQRTGTTLLQRLLACDPRLRVLASWEAINPAPVADRGQTGPGRREDPRIRRAVWAEKGLGYLAPDFFAIHPVQAHAPEEDCLLFDYGFWSTVPEATQRVPGFSRWLEEQDHRAAYAEHKQLLQLLQWQRSADRWLLKTPQHLEQLDALLHTYPDARILQTHRDPVRVLASFCSMMAHSRGVFSDVVDAREVAAHWFRKALRMIERSWAVRQQADPRTFLDVSYAELVADPLGTIHRVYEFLGLPLTPAVTARMEAWRARNPQHKHGRHRYRLEDFGLDQQAVDRAFADYRERFAIPREETP